MPTTNISSIGAGKDYATIAAWEAATDYDLVAADVVEIGEVYDDSMTLAGGITGATTDATRYRILRPASGLDTALVRGTGLRLLIDSLLTLVVNESYFRITGFELDGEAENGASTPLYIMPYGQVTRCIFYNWGSLSPLYANIALSIRGQGALVEDCVFFDNVPNALDATSLEGDVDQITVRRCSILGDYNQAVITASWNDDPANAPILDSVAALSTAITIPVFSGVAGTGSINNASSDVSAPGTSPSFSLVPSAQYVSVVAGIEDLTPKAGSTLENLGIGAFADAPVAPSGLTAIAASTTQINLAWTDLSSDETGFEVWRAPDVSGSPGTWAILTTTAAGATSYNNTGLTASTTYWYRVRAVNASGNSAYTSQVSEATLGLITVKQDGSGDYTTITEGLAAASSGVIVEVQDSGTYNEGRITIPGGVTLQSQTGQTPTIQGTVNELVLLNAADAVIDGFIIDYLGTNSGVAVAFKATASGAINAEATNLTIRNVGDSMAVRFSNNASGCSFHHSTIEEGSTSRPAIWIASNTTAASAINVYENLVLSFGIGFQLSKDVPVRLAGNTFDIGGIAGSKGIRTTIATTQFRPENNVVANAVTCIDLQTVDKSLWLGNVLEGADLTGFPASNVNIDPAFVGGANRRLQAGSPALDIGVDITDVATTDLDGEALATPYDAGCYQGTGGGPTTTYRVRTIKQDGTGDYATFAALFAAMPADLVAADEHWTVTVEDNATYAENPNPSFTADQERTLVMKAGVGFTPTIATTGLNGCYLQASYMIFQGFIVIGVDDATCIRANGTAIKILDCDVRASSEPDVGVYAEGVSTEIKRVKVDGAATGIRIAYDSCVVHNVLVRNASAEAVKVEANVNTCDFFHLTLDPNGGDGVVLNGAGISGNDFQNSIVKVTGSGKYCYRATASTWGAESDWNAVVAANGAKVGNLSATEYTTLAAWQAATSTDADSDTDIPPWADEEGDDYSLDAPFFGTSGLGVTDDIDGTARATTPSRGAYEFSTVYAFEQPTNLVAVPASATAINLAWTDNAISESSYEVERAPDAGGVPGTFAQIAELPADATFYADAGLVASTTYWYRVRASAPAGTSAYSATASAITETDPPPAPSNLAVVAGSTSAVNVLWTDNAGTEDEYEVQRAPDVGGAPGTFSEIASLAANSTSHEDTGLSAATTYWYRVRSVVGGVPSDWAGPVSVTTPAAATVPAAPTGLTVQALDSTRLRLAWTDAATTETGYAVERAPDDGAGNPGTWKVLASLPEGSVSHEDTGRPYGLPQWYRVKAVNLQGSSLYSSTVPGVTPEPEED